MAKKTDIWLPDRIENEQFVTRAVKQRMRELNGKQVEVCIRLKRFYVTQPQRGYYFGCVVYLVAEELRRREVTGLWGGPITDKEVHEMLGAKFLRQSIIIDPETAEYMDIQMSITEITVGEMSEYIERIKEWAREAFKRIVHLDDGTSYVKYFLIPEAGEQLTFV